MPILPIDVGTYTTPEMRRIFEEKTRVQKILDVEAALAWAHAEVGNIPRRDAEKIAAMASVEHVKLSRMKEIERETRHDVVALVKALAEACGKSGTYVHLGATSSDVNDTATALQLREALALMGRRFDKLQKTFRQKTLESKGSTTSTHVPTALTSKFSAWFQETSRHVERLRQCKERILVGKMSGAVGTQAAFGVHAFKIQKLVMERLGIRAADISTQIVQRDRYAELVCLLAIVAASQENLAAAILDLQKPEIDDFLNIKNEIDISSIVQEETSEACRRICSLARIVRSLAIPALENIITWHERDLTQSSAERFIIPQSCILVDDMLFLMTNVIADL
jgi:adenylosuccinate lyase